MKKRPRVGGFLERVSLGLGLREKAGGRICERLKSENSMSEHMDGRVCGINEAEPREG